jgi:valyl-tRNA synthetase
VRFGILSSSPAGGDLLFDEKLCEQGRNFCNKLWNALRLVKGWEVTPQVDADVAAGNALACQWFDALLAKTNAEINEKFVQYRLSDAMMTLYTFVWDDFCSWFLEMVKPAYGKPLDQKTMDFTVKAYESICILLHPFMPFITEELWHQLGDRKDGEDCMAARSLEQAEVSESELKNMDSLRAIVTGIRELRNQHNVGNSKVLTLYAEAHQEVSDEGNLALLKKLANLEQIVIEGSVPDDAFSFRAGTQLYHLDMPVDRNPEEEREKLNKEADYLRGFIKSVEKKLSNERFVAGAPADVVDKERQKLDDGKVKLAAIEEAWGKL